MEERVTHLLLSFLPFFCCVCACVCRSVLMWVFMRIVLRVIIRSLFVAGCVWRIESLPCTLINCRTPWRWRSHNRTQQKSEQKRDRRDEMRGTRSDETEREREVDKSRRRQHLTVVVLVACLCCIAQHCCTPYHYCCCSPCGGVVSYAPCACVNCFLCSCCRCYMPGLVDAPALMSAITQARGNMQKGCRSMPAAHQLGPGRVINMQ